MRLLERQEDGSLLLTDNRHINLPPYAILSHTWGKDCDEVTFRDMVDGTGLEKVGRDKIRFCAERAAKDGLRYTWVDSCCIDQTSSAELNEAINSMFRWYQGAAKCYVYLSDVSTHKRKDADSTSEHRWEPAFRVSRWFTRGWTLQELLAPSSVEFFSVDHKRLGNKQSLVHIIKEITGIPTSALNGQLLSEFSREMRMSWAAKRSTTREEDEVYSLLGIFSVSLPVIYGEGKENARRRLQKELDYIEGSSLETETNLKQLTDKDFLEPLLEALRFDQIEDRFLNIKRAHTRTCKWLLKSTEYLSWTNNDKMPEHHGLFWIKGKPGSGKSTLIKVIFMEMKQSSRNTTLLSFFFNARGTELEKNTIGMYRSLIVQLLEGVSDSQLLSGLSQLRRRGLGDKIKSNREMLKQTLADIMQTLQIQCITLVIDALDECDEDEVRDMVTFFEQLGEDAIANGRTLHVLFSSRHYPRITVRRSVEMVLEDQLGHSKDIESYLASNLRIGCSEQAEGLRQKVATRASGIFMWIVLVVSILNKASDSGMNVISLHKKLRELPSDLSKLFRDMLSRDIRNLDAMKLCLQWVLFANRPMRREELFYGILSGSEPENLSSWESETSSAKTMDAFILSSSKGLVEMSRSKNPVVQFIHESVRDFLLKENGLGQLWPELAANPTAVSHDCLRACCSNYLRKHISSDLSADGDLPKASTSEAEDLREEASRRFPFLEYSVYNVLAHSEAAHAGGVSQEMVLMNFGLSNWISLNNILEKYNIRRLAQDTDFLYVCAENNYPHLIDILARQGQCVGVHKARHKTAVLAAIAGDCHEALQALSRHKLAPDSLQFPGPEFTLCSFFLGQGPASFAPLLISNEYEFDIGWTFKNGEPLLHRAVEKQSIEVIHILLDKGADVNAQGGMYGNALQAASFEGSVEVVKMLLEKGANVNAQGGEYGNALQAASYRVSAEVAKMLLECGAHVNAQGGRYGNALQAVLAGPKWLSSEEPERLTLVQLLLAKGADVNVPGSRWVTALGGACVYGWTEIMELLLENGADFNVCNGRGYDVLTVVIEVDRGFLSHLSRDGIIELVLAKGKNISGKTLHRALQAASHQGHEKIVQLLLAKGARYDYVDEQIEEENGQIDMHAARLGEHMRV